MFTKFINHVICGLAIGLGLVMSACQPIQAPLQNGPKQSPGGPTVAFVRDRSLYIHPGTLAVTVEDCTIGCQVYYLIWSPDGKRLAYFYSPASAEDGFAIRLTDLTGQVQTVATNVGWITPPAWSPAGNQLAYLVATNRYVVEADVPRYVVEVWTTEVLASGMITNAHKHGEVSIGGDCGGGGRSESAALYETEGGLAYGGYLDDILAWTADDLLLYSNHCSVRGVGRFDLTTGTALAPYPGKLGSLSLNRMRDRWVAVDEQQRLVQGRPADLAYARVATFGDDGFPYITPVWQEWDGESMWIVPREKSAWIKHIQANPKVAVSCALDVAPYTRLIMKGNAEIIEGAIPMAGKCLEVANRMAVRYLGERGPEYLIPTNDRPRYLIKFTPVKTISWEGVEWHEKYVAK